MKVRFALDGSQGMVGCGATATCLEAFAFSVLAFVLWAGSTSLVLFAPTTNVRTAVSAVGAEMTRIRRERDAFEEFAGRVARLSPAGTAGVERSTSLATAGSPPALRVATGDGDDGAAAVRDAYRETVMAVDHYEAEYDEPLPEHVARELGEGLAVAVEGETDVSPELQAALVTGAGQASTAREELLSTLETEEDRLETAADELTAISEAVDDVEPRSPRRRRFEDLRERWGTLQECRRQLESFLAESQSTVQDTVTIGYGRVDTVDFHQFLYGHLDVRYPVLADGVALRDRMNDLDHRLTRAIAGRP